MKAPFKDGDATSKTTHSQQKAKKNSFLSTTDQNSLDFNRVQNTPAIYKEENMKKLRGFSRMLWERSRILCKCISL